MSTGPTRSGSLGSVVAGEHPTPSVDGHFDRISMAIDLNFGADDDFRRLCEVATAHHGVVIDDIVPGHTGKGADFRLAEMRYRERPGIHHMVEIPDLEKAGYIIGRLQQVIFYEPGVNETNWSATAPVVGVRGMRRRWVYLHYFKDGQPSINWLDPSCAGMRLVLGDACHSIADLGSGALRLDANGFLGVEKSASGPAWSEVIHCPRPPTT